jgi:hypothetical protein
MNMTVYEEIAKRAQVLQTKDPRLTSMDAEAQVLRDPELYKRYVQESSTPPERTAQAPRLSAEPTGTQAEAEVLRRADSLIAKSAGLSVTEAISEVFRDNPELYVAYSKQDSTPAPTFGSELLSNEMDDFYEYTGALLRTMAGILDSSAEDKGPRITDALGEFSAAVLGKLRQAGLSVPTEKRAPAHPLADDILACAQVFSPGDLGQGLVKVRYALGEIRKIAERKRAAA